MLVVSVAISSLTPAHAADLDIVGPAGSVFFGTRVVVLPNGNIVVTDPDGPVANIGAVYMYSPNGTLISTLTGGSSGDQVGSHGIHVLANGNFVVASNGWRNPATAAAYAGAVTWVNGATGLSGVVSESNSLVGTQSGDFLNARVAVLSNGNYVIAARGWDNGPVEDAGAAIWGSGNVGVSGPVTTSNALFGTQRLDQVGGKVVPLVNGNYVVGSAAWDNGAIANAGAATWANGSTGLAGAVSSFNSLVGTSANDLVGAAGPFNGIKALSNGNYVVSSDNWNNGSIASAGAATWANGSTGLVGVVSSANSLVGSSAGDKVGSDVTALTNGNYVVWSPVWKNGSSPNAGAATWGSGSSGVRGTISASNSLVGAGANDGDASHPPVELSNGNYVVINPHWDNGAIIDVGAVTWGNGASGRTGVISAANSLTGSTAGDEVGSGNTIALANGNYVVGSRRWSNGAAIEAGAATWGNGASGQVGVVSTANSLVGSHTYDRVGGTIVGLGNGNYVVASKSWSNGVPGVGAVTWGNGNSGRIGVVSASNSMIGSNESDFYGTNVLALANGDFVASSDRWNNGGVQSVGAFTRIDGNAGLVGVVSGANSITGSIAGDRVGSGPRRLGNNHYAVINREWDNGGLVNAGAVTILHNTARTRGLLSTANSVLGTTGSQGYLLNVAHDPLLDRAVVGRPGDNTVTVRALSLFADGFE
ncbi:MAG: hypothetical protein ABIY56_04525 [Dokdonella sp.]